MKMILITLIIVILNLAISTSVSITNNDIHQYHNQVNDKCDYTAFTTSYSFLGIELAMSYESYVVANTYYENGTIMVDYENNMSYFDYQDSNDGSNSRGQCFIFYNNQTQYVYSNITGSYECFITTPQINSIERVKDAIMVGTSRVGSSNTEIYKNSFSIFNYTDQYTTVDSSDCSIISIENINNMFYQGKAVWSFSNFEPKAIQVQVPYQCFESPKSMSNYNRYSHHYINKLKNK